MSYALTLPSVAGSLESYVQTVNSFPILTHAQELDYARRYRRDNDDSMQRANWSSRTCAWSWRSPGVTPVTGCPKPT